MAPYSAVAELPAVGMSVKASLEVIFADLYDTGEDSAEAAPAVTAPSSEDPETGADVEESQPDEAATADENAIEIDRIRGKLEASLSGTAEAAEHLVKAREVAAVKDTAVSLTKDHAYGREHRKTGLPVDDSKLLLDETLVAEHGLLHPRKLMTEVHAARSRTSAEPDSIFDLQQLEDATGDKDAHYMQHTRSFREQTSASPLTASIKSVRALRQATRMADSASGTRRADAADSGAAASKRAGEPRGPSKPLKPSPEVRAQEVRLVAKMQAPLHFIRNPRFVLPPRKPISEVESMQPKVPTRSTFIHCSPQEVSRSHLSR